MAAGVAILQDMLQLQCNVVLLLINLCRDKSGQLEYRFKPAEDAN
jgi:hypothetical protein